MKKNELNIFEEKQVIIINDKDTILFDLYSVGQAVGYETKSKDKYYPHKARIDKIVENAEIKPVVQGVQQYLTEDMLYDFLFEAKTDKAKAFRKWVKEVLVSIRENGAYVSQNITQEQEDKLLNYLAPRFRK